MLFNRADADSDLEDDFFQADQKVGYKKIEQLISIALRLRKLALCYGWDNTILDVNIHSESLESLVFDYDAGLAIQAVDIYCPALHTLVMPIILDEFDRNRLDWTSFCKCIKHVRIRHDRWHGTDRERDHLKRTQVFQMLGQMPALKELYFDGSCEKSPLRPVKISNINWEPVYK